MITNMTDEELMLAYQLGDEDAFHELYARHSGRVLAFLRSKLRDEMLVQDVFQSTFLKFHKSRARYNTQFPVVAWIFTVCRSELLDAIRKTNRLKEDFTSEVFDQVNLKPQIQVELESAGLNKDQLHAIHLRFYEDMAFEDIAKTLNTSPMNARQILSRSLNKLRRFYAKK